MNQETIEVTEQDRAYHELSLSLAKEFNTLYNQLGKDHANTIAAREMYIEARRKINKNDGVRYGHAEAYKVLRGS
jgi:hypothetical protein